MAPAWVGVVGVGKGRVSELGRDTLGEGRSWPLGRQHWSTLEEMGRGISGRGLQRKTEGVVESRACGEVCLGWV